MRIVVALLSIIVVITVKGQPGGIRLQGKIVDSAGTIVTGATVRLSGKTLYYAVSDATGIFYITNIHQEKYDLIITAAGYKEFQQTINPQRDTVISITLFPDYNKLSGVTVIARKPSLEVTQDKIIYNVAEDPSARSLTTAELLSRMPFISITGEGNVAIKGQENFQVLLNGRPTALFARNPAEALKAFPASTISKIEVMANPSSRYDGEASGGVINIITVSKFKGYNGAFSFSYNTTGQINPNASFNARYGKFSLASFIYRADNTGYKMHGYTRSNFPLLHTVSKSSDSARLRGFQAGMSLELTYEPDSTTLISLFTARGNGGGNTSRSSQVSTEETSTGNVEYFNFVRNDSPEFPTLEVGTDIIRKKRRHELAARFNIQFSDPTAQQSTLQDGTRYRETRAFTGAYNRQTAFQIDHSNKFSANASVLSGFKAIFRKASSRFNTIQRINPADSFNEDTSNTNRLGYVQYVYGGFLEFRIYHKGVSFTTGNRLEVTGVDAAFNGNSISQHYLTCLPSVNLSYTNASKNTLTLSYAKRINRPGISFLNPFKDRRDPYITNQGNERLGPELTHHLQLSLARYRSASSFNFSVFRSWIVGGILRTISQDSGGVIVQRYSNIGRNTVWAGQVFFSHAQKDRWQFTSNLLIQHVKMEGNKTISEYNSGWNGTISASFRYTPSKQLFLYTNLNYTSRPVLLQGRAAAFIYYNVGTGYWLRRDKWLVTGGLNNIFSKYLRAETDYSTVLFTQEQLLLRPFRAVSISIRYQFGKLSDEASRRKGIKIDDIKAESNN